MLRHGMTRREAAQEWVNGFNAIPTRMIEKLREVDLDDWHEVTHPAVGDRVYIFSLGSGEIVKVNDKRHLCKVKLDGGDTVWRDEDNLEVEYDGWMPMWGTMWSFDDSCDKHWLKEGDSIAMMSQCGFRIFESEEFGYFFGIDGAGYDFYEQHWLPLYDKRGLHWHDPKTDKKAMAA